MIYIDRESNILLYEQIFRQMKEEIETGSIRAGEMLPGIRSLAKTLGVARNTVEKAYAQLAVEGYIYSRMGVGFLATDWEEGNREKQREKSTICLKATKRQQIEYAEIKYDFQYGDFPGIYFPTSSWKKYTTELLFSTSQFEISRYQNKQGNESLRRELKKYLNQTRGVSCEEDQIIIGCGLHYSLDILCKLFQDSKSIAMEEPGYYGAREVFKNNGFSFQYIVADKNGLDLTVLDAMEVSAVYVTPSHQFPWGTVMSISKRKKILNWANKSNTYIIEDDYDSEYRYDANPVPSLQSLDKEGRVIYIGTFSKSLSPSLRVNYMVLPKQLLSVYHQLFDSYSSPVSWLTQEVLATYLKTGEYMLHVRKMCKIYRKKHDIVVQELNRQFGTILQLHGKGAGLHFLLEFPKDIKADALIETARKEGIRLYPVAPFWSQPKDCPDNLMFMGYSLMDEIKIREGIQVLQQIWKR